MEGFMKYVVMLMLLLVIGFSIVSVTMASPLTLDYSVNSDGQGLYHYSFRLKLDNHDGSWAPGQGWSGLVFGDTADMSLGDSGTLTDFNLDSNIQHVGPFTEDDLANSSGYHNGPTWLALDSSFAIVYWIPTSLGDNLNWTGTSTADLPQGELLFSTLDALNDANTASFETANRVAAIAAVPEPATFMLLGAGILGAGLLRKRIRI
jgi:hypothetical protein